VVGLCPADDVRYSRRAVEMGLSSSGEDALRQWACLRGYLITSQETADGVRFDLWGPHDVTLVLEQVERSDVENFLARI